jgi:hypothetical protein
MNSLESQWRLSRKWPRQTLLLDFDSEERHIKGLAKARAGKLEHWQISY